MKNDRHRSHCEPPFYYILITRSNTAAAGFVVYPTVHLVWLVRVGILVQNFLITVFDLRCLIFARMSETKK